MGKNESHTFDTVEIHGRRGKSHKAKAHNAVRHAETIEGRERAWALRVSGLSFHEIGTSLGVCAATAHKYVNERMQELNTFHSNENREENLRLALVRAESELNRWLKVLDATPRPSPRAGALVFKFQELVARLQGLIATPVEIQPGAKCSPAEVLERVKQVAGNVVAPLVAEKLSQFQLPAKENPE